MTEMERTLETIVREAESIRPQEHEDAELFFCIGAVAVNAIDALEIIRKRRADATFKERFPW